MGYGFIGIIACLPTICVIFCFILISEYVAEKKEKIKKEQKIIPPRRIVRKRFVTENELRATEPPRGRLKKVEENNLQAWLTEHAKQLAKYMESEAFFIPRSACSDIAEKLLSYLNSLEEVEYAILEEDGIHVKVRR